MTFNVQNIGQLVSGLAGLFGNKNPANVANQYISQIPSQAGGYYQPYVEAGRNALPTLQNEYSQLISQPGEKLNQIGQSFQESPGFNFALQRALQGSSHAAAAGGYAGSPQHQEIEQQIGTNLGNQDYYNWLRYAMGLYGNGLQGEQGLANTGYAASSNLSDLIAQSLAQQANYSYAGQAGKNLGRGAAFSNLGAGLFGAFSNPVS